MIGKGRKNKQPVKSKETLKKEREDKALLIIQCAIRVFLAKVRATKQAKRVWQRVFDPTYKKYFWYQKLTKTSNWGLPKRVILFDKHDIKAAIKIEKVVRGFMGRMRVKRVATEYYSRFFDPKSSKFYWLDKATETTSYTVSSWLARQEIPLPPEDQLIYEAYQKIKDLEAQLKSKDQEIKDVRKKRFEELEPEVLLDKVSNAKVLKRSRNMDEWQVEELAAWFTELKMEQHIQFLFDNRVDGVLFVNLNDDDWADMGITSRFHTRKLQLAMKGYRHRYMKKKNRIEDDEDDELISEYSPSEVSDIIHKENDEDDYEEDEEDDEFENQSQYSEEDDMARLEEEAAQQAAVDQQNIVMQVLNQGDATNFPIIGDIVRVKYVCLINDSSGKEKVIMSTKNVLQRPWVEFVLGIEQVLLGFDRAIPQMSVGERTKMIFSPEYGYGKEGLPPHIPPNSTLIFDLTLLGFRPRTAWVKPLLQDENTKEKPYGIEWANFQKAQMENDRSRYDIEEDDEINTGRPDTNASGGGSTTRNSMSK